VALTLRSSGEFVDGPSIRKPERDSEFLAIAPVQVDVSVRLKAMFLDEAGGCE
jgi:hypothetical protein